MQSSDGVCDTALSIAKTGWDAEPKGDLKNKLPSDMGTEKTIAVPGINPPIVDAVGVSQALTWVTGDPTPGGLGMAQPSPGTDATLAKMILDQHSVISIAEVRQLESSGITHARNQIDDCA
jgi:hypothetical protein